MHLFYYQVIAAAIVVLVMMTCTVFYAIGNVGTRDQLEKDYQLPPIAFDFVFALGTLYFSLGCFIYVLFNIDISSIGLILPSTVMLTSFVLLYIKLYFSLKVGDVNFKEVQTFAFNIFINAIVLIINTLLTAKKFIKTTLAMFPILLMSIYFLYIGHLVAKN